MARTASKSTADAPRKEPGRIRQLVQVLQMTVRADPSSLWFLIAAFLAPLLAGIALGLVLSRDNWFGMILYLITGIMGGLLVFLLVLGRLAERAAFAQIEGRAGAVSAVIKNSLRGGWTGSEMPVAVSPRTQDAVYRVVGRGGVALIGEGPVSRTQRMIDEQRRSIARVLPNVPIHQLTVGPDAQSVRIHKLSSSLRKFKKVLRKAEVRAIANRLESLSKTGSLPIPKGVDPMKARAPRPR